MCMKESKGLKGIERKKGRTENKGSTSNKPTPYLHVLHLKSYKVNTEYGTVRGTIIVIFGKRDPSDGYYSPCLTLIFGTVSALDG